MNIRKLQTSRTEILLDRNTNSEGSAQHCQFKDPDIVTGMQASNKQFRHECRAAQDLLILAVEKYGARNMQIREQSG